MNSIRQQLDLLLQQTEENISKEKDYRFSIQKGIPDKLKKEYYKNYLLKSIDKNAVRTVFETTADRYGNSKEVKVTYEAMPVHHYNTILAMAFYKAREFYGNVRSKTQAKSKEVYKTFDLPVIENTGDDENEISSLSAVECLMLSRQIKQGKNSTLIKDHKKGDRRRLIEFEEREVILFEVLKELRNYHAHIFHEPGPLYFDNFYGDEYKPEKKLSIEKWKIARDYFEGLFNDVRQHLLKTVEKQLEDNKLDGLALKEISAVKNRLTGHEFQTDGIVTHEALLFIACNFLRKSDANYFIKKWTGVKKAEGFSKTSQTFFNYYAHKDSKSLLTQNADIFKFRQLIGLLGTMPELKNDCFKPFYKLIKVHNDFYGDKVDRERNIKEKEKIQTHLIPLRKSQNYTPWYMGYLKDRGLLNDFKIAYYKTPEEREAFLEANGITETIQNFKGKMKQATGEEKRKLTGIYKEIKKNFLFKDASTEDDNFCTKRENAIVKYHYKKPDGKTIAITVNLSPALLMKWVFADITLSKGEEVKRTITSFIAAYYQVLSSGKTVDMLGDLPAAKIFPSSLLNTTEGEPVAAINLNKANALINTKKYELQKFIDENNSKRAPWKFAAKRKIDIIFDYVHYKYISLAYDNNKDENTRRHEALNDSEYLDAFEKIRFYGREYLNEEFKQLFLVDKRIYFSSIIKYFQSTDCISLEKIFNAVAHDYIEYFSFVEKKMNIESLEKFIKVFKINKPSRKSDVVKHAHLFAVNQSIPHELINVCKLAEENTELASWNESNSSKGNERATDFSLMRYYLSKSKPFTNTDYMMQCIMPILLKHKKMPLSSEGKIYGSTALFNKLMASKTEELVLWNIANYYWKKANKKDNTANKNIVLKRNEGDMIEPAYKLTSVYNKLFKNPIEVKLQREVKKGITNTNPVYSIEIKPTKFDDEFQHVKQENLIDYIELCMTDEEKKTTPWQFEELNKRIQDKLAKYLDDVYLILTVEKFIVQKNISDLKKEFKIQTGSKLLPEIYLRFGESKTADDEIFENILSRLMYKELETVDKLTFNIVELIGYRNKAMHQQLQPEEIHIKIRKALFEYCLKNGILTAK